MSFHSPLSLAAAVALAAAIGPKSVSERRDEDAYDNDRMTTVSERSAERRELDRELEERGEHRDDPGARAAALAERWGVAGPAARAQRNIIAAEEARRWAPLMPNAPLASTVKGEAWVNVGPSDALEEYNDVKINGVDSGRPTAIAIDPRDANVVYVALAGGGVWKTYDFVKSAPTPSWIPIGEELGALAVGALALDPQNPDTVYIALGDAFDQGGNGVYKSTNGGATWSAPVILPGNPGPTAARELHVDAFDPRRIWVLTDVGLYLSTDSGAHFATVNLPISGSGTPSVWSLAQTGKSRWVVEGRVVPTSKTANSTGDFWFSDDGGNTWRSLIAAGTLPAKATEFGRVTLATGKLDPDGDTMVYAFVSNASSSGSRTLGFWRSFDGGHTWSVLNSYLDPDTKTADDECNNMDVGHDQSWYNRAIVVDPTNDAAMLAGGNLCGLRTFEGKKTLVQGQPGAKWQNAAIWIQDPTNSIAGGLLLPYVHADWHVAVATVVNGKVLVIVGTDGGIFSSMNVFDPATPVGSSSAQQGVKWSHHNKGLVTHLAYTVGSGDPATGNAEVITTGLQDNGTRLRSTGTPTAFNMVVGGDGIGVAVNKGSGGEWYWTSVPSSRGSYRYCRADTDPDRCTKADSWQDGDPGDGGATPAQFQTRYDPVVTDASGASFLTNTKTDVWKSSGATWAPYGSFGSTVLAVRSSATVAGLSGAAVVGTVSAGSKISVTSDDGATWTASNPVKVGTTFLSLPSSIDFPPTTPAGKQPGDVYVVAMSDADTPIGDPVPASVGHLFITTDRGQTWSPLSGDGSGDVLPNVPAFAVRFDPNDTTNSTLYVGTDLGVYRTTDAGKTWSRYGFGLPLVRVTDLFIARNSLLLRIATYGRGIWEIYPDKTALRGVSGDGDFDRNQVIDYRDLAATASRVGTDPTTSGQPGYFWLLDIDPGTASPAVSGIDQSDLDALLSRIGGHP